MSDQTTTVQHATGRVVVVTIGQPEPYGATRCFYYDEQGNYEGDDEQGAAASHTAAVRALRHRFDVEPQAHDDSYWLDLIHEELDGAEWTGGTIERVGDLVEKSGRKIAEPGDDTDEF